MQEEIWKDIPGYEGRYKISNFGNIQSLNREVLSKGKLHQTIPTKYIKQQKDKRHSYLYVDLYDNISRKRFRVHRLVAMTFIPNPNNYPQINHIDGNKQNNSANNLEWCTQSHNMKEAYKIGLEKPRTLKVNQYDLSNNFIRTWDSIKSIQIFYNNRNISACCKGKRKTAGGYIWRYAD